MSGTPAVTADAAGISDNAKMRTGSVVDQLLAPDIVSGGDTVVHIETRFIVPHPLNRKILDEDVEDIVAGLRAGGRIINPLGVTAAADWNANHPDGLKDIGPGEFIITAGGHRRLRSVEIVGQKTVPCIIRADGATVAGRRDSLLENVARKDLDAFEEAAAVAELTGPPYKMAQRTLAGLVGCSQPHISRRLKLLKLPDSVRARYDTGQLTIGDCLELVSLVDVDTGLVDLAVTRIIEHRWTATHAVDRVLADHNSAKLRTAETDKLTAAGVRILDRAPAYHLDRNGREPVRLEQMGIPPAKHKKEPCHAAYVNVSGNFQSPKAEVVYACTEPKRHAGPKAASAVKTTTTAAASPGMSDDERNRRNRVQELKKTVTPARRAVVAQMLARGAGGFDTDTRRLIITQSVIDRAHLSSYVDLDIVIDLLGARPSNDRAELDDVYTAYAQRSRDLAALAGALGYYESRLRDPRPYDRWGDQDRWYLDLLARHGYVITDAEHDQLGDIRGDDGTWTPAKDDSVAAQCKVCFAFLHDLPAGVTKVAEDLCSGCSDAADAGWIDDDAPVVPDAAKHYECPACEGGRTVLTGHEEDAPATCERCNGEGVVPADGLKALSA